ncbi:hypothetical protein WDU94_012696 [Cyamophila willieti]
MTKANVEQQRHRPGLLKQTNKTHKHGKHKSKGSLETLKKGKVNVKVISKKVKKSTREDRRNQATQIRKNKRDEVLSNRRKLLEAPFMVAVVPLSTSIVMGDVMQMIEMADSEAVVTHSSEGHLHISLPRFKQRFTFVLVDTSNIFTVLDALKAADTVLFLMSPSEGIDPTGHVLLTAIIAQGLPTTAMAIFNLNDVPIKKRNDCKIDIEKKVSRYVPDEKVMGLSNAVDVLNILRKIGNQKQRKVLFRDRRPHLLAEKLDFVYKENEEFLSSDEEENSEEEEADEDDEDDAMSVPESNRMEEDPETMSTYSEAPVDKDKYDKDIDLNEEEEALQKLKEARMDAQFPDELDTPLDTPARVRFQKYRGLESFRTSDWDSKENLPLDYARIFQFQNFERTRKRVLKQLDEEGEGAQPGWYITVHIDNVTESQFLSYQGGPLLIYGLLQHEQKMSVVNMLLKRPATLDCADPIANKEELWFQTGYRRFKARPIFSQHTNGNKHKFERFFQPEGTVIATCFAPIMFPPAPVLAFKKHKDESVELVALGSVHSVNPDRIVVKRVILSGHPLKINKRSATVRFMFFNREDIEWFKPVELRTKYGRRGHIKEPLGTHGHMKCLFDGQLKSQDTVLMTLYKRVFPKWDYELV